MSLIPRPERNSDEDYLFHIISLARYYFGCKYVKWCSYYCSMLGVACICTLIFNLVCNSEIVVEQDVFCGAIIFEMITSNISLEVSEKTIKKLIYIKTNKFWSHTLLPAKQKRHLHYERMAFVSLHLVFWSLALIITIVSLTPNTKIYPKFTYDMVRPIVPEFIFKIGVAAYISVGYFIGTANECYYAYVVLHNYFQMKILMSFIREALGRYKRVGFKRKIFDSEYQLAVEEILKRSIQQFQELKLYGREISSNYSQLTPYHILAGAMVISVGVHSALFGALSEPCFVALVTLDLAYGFILYTWIGQLFSETYVEFCEDVQKVEWYSMNIKNQKLYYMFLMYSQRESFIDILPSVHLTRSVTTQFVKMIYSCITLLRSFNT